MANEKLSSNHRNKFDEVGQLQKQLSETKQSEMRLQSAYTELQNETNKRLEELSVQILRDKEGFKARLVETEKKAKEAEQRRTQLLFSIEKERANWQLEEDHLRRKQAELEEFIQNLEKSKETLKKENMKLRNDARSSSTNGPKKQFIFAKGAQHLLNQTATSMGLGGAGMPPKSGLLKQVNDAASLEATTQNSTNGASQGSILNAAMNRLKENQNSAYASELKQSTSSMDIKQRMASPNVD